KDKDDKLKNILNEKGISLSIIPYQNPDKLINNLQEMDKIITSKLHVGIVGYALGKRTLSIPFHPKTIRFYEQIKREEFCIPVQNINTQLLCDKFEQLNSLVTSKNLLFKDAVVNKEIIFEFLDKINN